MWNNSHGKLTGKRQNDSCTAKAAKKMFPQPGRMEKAEGWDTCLKGIWKEKKVATRRPSPWGASGLSHRLGNTVMGVLRGDKTLRSWENCWDRQKAQGSRDDSWGNHTCWLTNNQEESFGGAVATSPHSPRVAWVSGPSHSTSQPDIRSGLSRSWEDSV